MEQHSLTCCYWYSYMSCNRELVGDEYNLGGIEIRSSCTFARSLIIHELFFMDLLMFQSVLFTGSAFVFIYSYIDIICISICKYTFISHCITFNQK